MLNELRDLSRSLKTSGVEFADWHPNFKKCPKRGIICFIYLNERGNIEDITFPGSNFDITTIRKWEKANGCSFPAFNVPPLYKTGSSLITEDKISNSHTLLPEIQGDTKLLTTKLLQSILKKANQVVDENKEDIVNELNAIRNNLAFYKDEIFGKDIKLSPEAQKELNNLWGILDESGELKKKECDLSDSEKENIKWFNIYILTQVRQIGAKKCKK